MAKKKKENKYERLLNWLMIASLLVVFIGFGFLKNYSWLKEQNSKPFGARDSSQ